MCAKHFLHCSSFIFYIFRFLDQSSIAMATLLYHIFLKSYLLFEIFLVEVKKYILRTFVSFQLVSRRISRAKEKTSLRLSFSIVEESYGFFKPHI